MAHDLNSLRMHTRHRSRFEHLPPDLKQLAEELLREYCARPQHASRMRPPLYAALCGAASRVAQHGPPPNRYARLDYRMHKKRRARQRMIEMYGDPTPSPRD